MALSPLRPSDPERLGPYQLHGRLGSGGMGVVYLAFGPDNQPVALKVLQPVLAQDEQYRARFLREVNAARTVQSPYVARVVAADTDSDTLWMATEYVEGATLAHAVEQNGPVPRERLRGLSRDLASAVAALHRAGVVHRDLKPANVVLAWSGPKLIDFGIAKQEDSTDLTSTGITVGSPLWMSPEVLSGQPASRSSDIFAWGLCVAYAGTGRPPFGAGNSNAVALRILNAEPDLAGLDGELRNLVAAALAKDPRRRPNADQLCEALGGRGAPATAVVVARPEGGWTGPREPGMPTGQVPPWPPPGDPSGVGGGGPPKRRSVPWALVAVAAVLVAVGIAIGLLVHGGSNPKAGPTPTPTVATPTAPRSSAVTTAPTGAPTSRTPSAPPSTPATSPPTTPTPASLSAAENTVLAAGYTPYPDSASNWDPSAPINVVLGTLTGSADGYNNWAFFFAGNTYIGHDAKDPSLAIAYGPRTPTQITLTYTIYGPSDPNCCPTQPSQSVRFMWTGTQLVPLDPIPPTDPTGNHR